MGSQSRLEMEQVKPRCWSAVGSYLRIATTCQPRPGVPIRALKDGQKGAAGGGQSKAALETLEQGWGMRTVVGGHYYG